MVTAGLSIYDTMQYVTCDVATYCIGQCASMGAVLLAAGAKGKRNALPHSRVMIHQPLAGTEGTTTEILIHAKEFIRLKRDLNEILLRHTGQSLERLEKDMRDLKHELFRSEAQNDALQRELSAVRKEGVTSAKPTPEQASQTYTLKSIVLARGTGGYDEDGVPGDEAIQLVLEPRDVD